MAPSFTQFEKRLLLATTLVILIAFGAVFFFQNSKLIEKNVAKAREGMKTHGALSFRLPSSPTYHALGEEYGNRGEILSHSIESPWSGEMVRLTIREGDRVRKKQAIAKLKNDELKQRVERFLATRDRYKKEKNEDLKEDLQRVMQSLRYELRVSGIGDRELKQIEREGALSGTVFSPFDGKVVKIFAKPGARVFKGRPIAKILPQEALELRTDLPEEVPDWARDSRRVRIFEQKRSKTFVAKRVPSASKNEVRVQVGGKIDLKGVSFIELVKERDFMLLPKTALIRRNGDVGVIRVRAKRRGRMIIYEKQVQLGESSEDFVEVRSGLTNLEQVVPN